MDVVDGIEHLCARRTRQRLAEAEDFLVLTFTSIWTSGLIMDTNQLLIDPFLLLNELPMKLYSLSEVSLSSLVGT